MLRTPICQWMLPLLVAALAGQVTVQAQVRGTPDMSLLQYNGPDRAQRLLASAKKEGSLTFYTTIAEKDIPTIWTSGPNSTRKSW